MYYSERANFFDRKAKSHYFDKKYEFALSSNSISVELVPHNIDFIILRGKILEKFGKLEFAFALFSHAQTLDYNKIHELYLLEKKK